MDNQQNHPLPCRLCGTAAHVPPVVDGGDHQHHQVACNECGLEVSRLSAAEALDVWNRLMLVAQPPLNADSATRFAAARRQHAALLAALKQAIEFVPTGYGIERQCWMAIAAAEEWPETPNV
jgi:hypothetical protein